MKTPAGLLAGFVGILLSSSSAMAGEGTLRVLTLNVFAGTREMDFDRLDRQMKAVRELQPDVVCLQEVYDHRVRTRYHAAFSDFGIYGDDHDTDPSFLLVAAELAASTAGEKAIAHGYRTDEVLLLNNQRGQSFPDSKIVHTFPNEAPDSKDAGGTLMSWGVSALESLKPKGYVSVRYQVDGVDVTVASMRLTNGVHNPKRAIQVKELIGRLFHTEDTENPRSFNFAPIILCGDTNADGEEPEMRWMREKAGFHDTYLEGNPDREHAPHAGMTWSADNDLTHNGNLTEPDQRVDYVLFAPGDEYTFETIGSRIVFDEAPLVSDHFGVLTELRLIRNPECTLNGIVLGTDACKKKFFEP